MPEILSSLFSSNPYFSAGIGVLGFGAGLAALRQGLVRGSYLARRKLLVSLEIPSKDKSYQWFLHWMSKQLSNNSHSHTHQYAVQTSFKQHDNGSISTTFSLIPGPGKHYFKWRGVWLQVERQRDAKLLDITSGSPWEIVTLTTLSRDKYIFSELLQESKKLALEQQEGKTVIYTSWGPEWRPFGLPRKRRLLDSVILDKGIKERIIKDVKEFINNGIWYNERGIPYRRGYLLYGPPGSGKSSFIQALAGELEYNICILNLSERGLTDDRLNHLLSNAPERSIMLLEDIDATFTQKRQPTDQQGYHSMVTFSGLLNALDGVASSEERIIFMTTNHVELLDKALVRPGRIDVKELFDNASDHQIKTMFLRFYEGENQLAEEFVQSVKGKKVSMAQLQGHFVFYKNDPKCAVRYSNSFIQDA
ncbi:1741_t:CDS:2 [Funneliformis caledonium]|uniref:1741_t:CDS:1 n=1 Tax=Funneliformis caledonium TaxID=1117310 RepID=A0A9N9AS82_9GLOM|nr:1741_t:CDS:2 [Funneliformis caledonium]